MFWMLTGDKVETAIDIGYSCQLVTPEMELTKLANVLLPVFLCVLDSCIYADETSAVVTV